jgi:hypothetical protein
MKLNIGCETRKLDGFVNVDIDPSVKPEIVGDAERMGLGNDSCDPTFMRWVS